MEDFSLNNGSTFFSLKRLDDAQRRNLLRIAIRQGLDAHKSLIQLGLHHQDGQIVAESASLEKPVDHALHYFCSEKER